MCEGITSNRSDFVNKSTSQSAYASSCKFVEKSELFQLNICLQEKFWKRPDTSAGFLHKNATAVPQMITLIFFSGLSLPFTCGWDIKCLIEFKAGQVGITIC